MWSFEPRLCNCVCKLSLFKTYVGNTSRQATRVCVPLLRVPYYDITRIALSGPLRRKMLK